VSFTGRVPDVTVAEIVSGARALVMTSVEEFGIAAVESQAAGRPVIARRGGGALETVIDGVTGCFWSGGPQELASAVLAFDDGAIDPEACVRNATQFDAASFRAGILGEVNAAQEGARPAAGSRQPLASTRLVTRSLQGSRR